MYPASAWSIGQAWERRSLMQEPIIAIYRASESWIYGLIKMGILEITEDGLKCRENVPTDDRESE